MKTFFTFQIKALLILMLFCIGNVAYGQSLLLEEDFDFAAGSDVVGQNDWNKGTAGTNPVTVSDAGLTYLGYPNTAGNAATFVPLTDRIQKNFTASLTGSFYYSFLINVSSAGSGEFFIGYYSNNAFRGRAYLKADGDGFQLGLVKTSTGSVTYTTGTPYSFGTTYLVVVKYEFLTGSTTDDKVSLFVNPDLSADEPAVADIGPLTDAGNDVSSAVLAVQGRNNSGNFTLDGIRVATNWATLGGAVVENHFLELPKFINSGMVIQRETPMKLFGWGTTGDVVKAEFKRGGDTFSNTATVGEDGKWIIELPQQTACSNACELVFTVTDHPELTQTLTNILVGDVWLAAGQSNMEKKVSHLLEAEDYIREADNYPLIRSCRSSYNPQLTPQEKVNGSSTTWFVCNSTEVGEKVSAVAYVFARKVFEETNIPIGIMQSYRGGTELETWMSPGKLSTDPELRKVAGRKASLTPGTASNYHSINFNGQINPLTDFPIKGIVWYQGESNTKRALEYRFMMRKLIEDWRSLWNLGDLPFYYVQMFNVNPAAVFEESNWADIREQQSFLLLDDIQNVGMAVSIDTNEDPANKDDAVRMHPRNKKPVGERLALAALKNTYGQSELIAEGPSLSRYEISNDSIYLYFKDYGAGLKMKDGDEALKGFMISGSDKSFKAAIVNIENDSTISVKSNDIAQPVAVRYAWSRNPICNLYNSENLPASPFRTDDWATKVSYTNFPSTFNADENADLISISLNGVILKNFNASQLTYNVSVENINKLPAVKAITYSPFSKLVITENKAEHKVLLTVTAENNSVKTYELVFDGPTGLNNNLITDNISVYQDTDAMVVNNISGVNLHVNIYNSLGQCLINDNILSDSKKKYSLQAGLYIINTNHDKSGNIKFLMK